jgi:hypothetical protein
VLVFDNAHHPARERRIEVLLQLERLARAAAAGRSLVLFTSWDVLGQPLDFPVFEVRGLAAGELAGYFGLYGLELSAGALEYIGGYADDFVCLEMFVRSAPWRAAVETQDASRVLPREPGELLSYWITRYLAEHVPARGLGILLALAVLEQPADYEMLEAVADAEGSHAALDLLRTSPPLVETASGRYGAHLNVRRAVLVTADKSQVEVMHRRAATCLADRHDFAAAARHRLRSGEADQALALIRDHREAIIGAAVRAAHHPRELQQHPRRLRRGVPTMDVRAAELAGPAGDRDAVQPARRQLPAGQRVRLGGRGLPRGAGVGGGRSGHAVLPGAGPGAARAGEA